MIARFEDVEPRENRRGLSPFVQSSEPKGTVPLSADGSRIGTERTFSAANAKNPRARRLASI
jgi:hypothetical protein